MSDKFDFAKLSAPFPANRVSWRVGSTTQDKKRGMALAYIDARDVMERLDEVCGPAGWQCRYPHANGKTVCEIGILVGTEWIWKADGAGDSDVEAAKGALSDAFKRAAVRWGIGRYLYDIPSPWVAIEQHGKSYTITPSELTRLAKQLGGEKPSPEAPSDNKSLDETVVRDDLISRIHATKTADELEALVRARDFVASYKSLSDEALKKVGEVGNARRIFFSNIAMAG